MARRPEPDSEPPKRRKPSSEWKKTARMRTIKDTEPDFVTKTEPAHHFGCHIGTIDEWMAAGTIPPPHSRLGVKHPVWLRKHYNAYRDKGEWPKEAGKWGSRD